MNEYQSVLNEHTHTSVILNILSITSGERMGEFVLHSEFHTFLKPYTPAAVSTYKRWGGVNGISYIVPPVHYISRERERLRELINMHREVISTLNNNLCK